MNKLRCWFVSDTHGKHWELTVPDNIDVVFHCGDVGTVRDPYTNEVVVRGFLDWFKRIPAKYKVFIAGNHDTSIEHGLIRRSDIPENVIYLEHESVNIEGFNIFGSPYTPSFGQGWAYNVARHKIDNYWQEIPDDTDILLTHGPALGILDLTRDYNNYFVKCGCKSLLNHINRVKPLVHAFGHIHTESDCPNTGILEIPNLRTKFINCSVLDLDYKKSNNGIIIELEK